MLEERRKRRTFTASPSFSENNDSVSIAGSLEAAFERRYARALLREQPIVCEFTQDRALLHQYFELRERMYKHIWKLKEFDGAEDVYDKIGHILIVRMGKLCVAGCRIIVREADENFLLPMETPQFHIRDILGEDACAQRHCEVSRFTIVGDKYEKEITYMMYRAIFEKLIELDVHHVFVKSPYTMARNWRKAASLMGVNDCKIYDGLNIPENPLYPEIKWYISHAVLSPQSQKKLAAPSTYVESIH